MLDEVSIYFTRNTTDPGEDGHHLKLSSIKSLYIIMIRKSQIISNSNNIKNLIYFMTFDLRYG